MPALALYVFILVIPSLRGIAYSFTDWNGVSAAFNFVGLDNFARLVTDPFGRGAVMNTVLLATGITVLQVITGLLLALALNSAIKGRNFLRVLFFAPVMVMPVVTSYLWKYILGGSGALNQILQAVGLSQVAQPWLGQRETALVWIILVAVWQGAGVTMAIYLAGLQTIPREIREAVDLDGAGPWARLWYITMPLLRPATSVATLLVLIGSLKLFDQVWVLTQGGPANSTDTLATTIYRTSFAFGEFSYGVTLAVALSLIVAVIAIIQQRVANRRTSA
ncbi:sugar ABC transporter permease [Acrocarpospora pleiomorpha]|uniref:carbohydrate ABC transporter permease n=1 Tax=Acrocarpospora pleiomorpha TaxID=90975 RepID=UPI0031D3B70F